MNSGRLWLSFILFLFLTFSFCKIGYTYEFSGTFDSYHSFRFTEGGGILVSKNIFNGDISLPVGKGYFNLSFRGTQNSFVRPVFQSEIREAYLEYSIGKFEVRVGRQIIPWGKMEKIRISDIINPQDLREYISYDYEELKIGVDALQLNFFSDRMRFDLIWVPFFRSSRSPSPGSPWDFGYPYIPGSSGERVHVDLPVRSLKNSELFAKVSFFLKWADIGFFGFSSFNDLPEVFLNTEISDNDAEYKLKGEFHKMSGVGFEFTKPVDFIILKGEMAFVKGFGLKSFGSPGEFIRKDKLQFALGLDILLRGEFQFSIQFVKEKAIGIMQGVIPDQLLNMMTFKISKKFFRNKLDVSNFFFIMTNGSESYNRTKMCIYLTDELHLIAGTDIFNGNGDVFGKYKKNSQFWIKLSYMF